MMGVKGSHQEFSETGRVGKKVIVYVRISVEISLLRIRFTKLDSEHDSGYGTINFPAPF